jgi:hypothetical protein
MTDPRSLHFNGINANTGAYLFPPTSIDDLAQDVAGDAPEEEAERAGHLAELRARAESRDNRHFGVKSGIDVRDLAQTGWAVVLPAAAPGSSEAIGQDAILEALAPLLELRRSQATSVDARLFKIYRGSEGYRPNESKRHYLARLGIGPGRVDPHKVPYYLLLLANPEEIPYSFQYDLDIQYAVGRLCFDRIEDYAHYARSVVAAETTASPRVRELAMVAVANTDDPATELSSGTLVAPLAELLVPLVPDWKIRRYEGEQATKANLLRLLGGDATPAVLFTASHGVGFDPDDNRQRSHQGALLCQDWPGPSVWRRKIPPEFYVSGDDISGAARLNGLITFHFACYSVGTPMYDEFSHRAGMARRTRIAHASFVAALPQRLLAGGALATIGHVDRAWGTSFAWPDIHDESGPTPQLAVFESALRELLGGMPIGAAFDCFHERYAELGTELSGELQRIDQGLRCNRNELAMLWTATNDARGWAIVGDPAVRLPQPHAAAP